MGRTRYFGIEHNLYWNLGNMTGEEFEYYICDILNIYLHNNNITNVNIQQTPHKNDNGKDIVLKFTCETIALFGITISRVENRETVVYIESKSTNSHHRLSRDKYIPSIEKGSHDNIDYYMLVTNSKLLPKDYYDAECLFPSEYLQ